jgi:hypothetical protein
MIWKELLLTGLVLAFILLLLLPDTASAGMYKLWWSDEADLQSLRESITCLPCRHGKRHTYLGIDHIGRESIRHESLTYDLKWAVHFSYRRASTEFNPLLHFIRRRLTIPTYSTPGCDISAVIIQIQCTSSLADPFSATLLRDLTLALWLKILYTKISGGGLFLIRHSLFSDQKTQRISKHAASHVTDSLFHSILCATVLIGRLTTIETTQGDRETGHSLSALGQRDKTEEPHIFPKLEYWSWIGIPWPSILTGWHWSEAGYIIRSTTRLDTETKGLFSLSASSGHF